MSLPPLKYPVANPKLGEPERKYLKEAIDTNWISSAGPFINQFEESFSTHFGPGHSVAVGSGTMAIELALEAVGVSPGDEVIVPNFTFVGSVSPIYRLHAIPVLAPTEPDGWSMDTRKLESLLTHKTKAIIAVHLYGVPCDIKAIMSFANQHGLKVIEDCAEALGATVDGQQVGTFGDVGCFSFFGNKVLTTGEGGVCITQDKDLSELIRLYRDHGMSKDHRYWHKVIGYNGRMTNLQAAVGLGQCERADEMISRRKEISRLYDEVFDTTPYLRKYAIPDGVENVCWLKSPVLQAQSNLNRDQLLIELREKGIEGRPFFYPCSSMPAYARFGLDDPNSIDVASHGFNLPTYPNLTDSEVKEIAETTVELISHQYDKSQLKTILPDYPTNTNLEEIHVSIILPTLNEEKHIVSIIHTLRQQMVSVSKSFEILVVDDNSSDNTVRVVEETFQRDVNIKTHVRINKPSGLALSLRDGIEMSRGAYILIMDSNHNHDPEVTSQMVKFSEFYDLVSGSRFTTGGGMSNKLEWFSNLLFNLLIRIILLVPTQDNLAGFFCIKKTKLLSLDLDFIFKNHGDYFFRLIYSIHLSKAQILEIPFVSKSRSYGKSKKSFLNRAFIYLKEIISLKI